LLRGLRKGKEERLVQGVGNSSGNKEFASTFRGGLEKDGRLDLEEIWWKERRAGGPQKKME
jgi:hypothetical protein